jgi:hypothetical protein
MAYFAELNNNNEVIRVVVVPDDINTSNGPLNENPKHIDGEEWCRNNVPDHSDQIRSPKGVSWKECFKDTTIRGIFPGVNCIYSSQYDIFVPYKPAGRDDWIINPSTLRWEPIHGWYGETLPNGRIPFEHYDTTNTRWLSLLPPKGNSEDIDPNYIFKNQFYWNPDNNEWVALTDVEPMHLNDGTTMARPFWNFTNNRIENWDINPDTSEDICTFYWDNANNTWVGL